MRLKILFSVALLNFFVLIVHAQGIAENDTSKVPVIDYAGVALKYEIADIQVTGAENYEDFVLIGFSGLSVGDVIAIPGEAITNAVKRFWKQGLFSDVKIFATKISLLSGRLIYY